MADINNKKAARLIDAERRALAESVVARQYELHPGLLERYGEAGRDKCVQDTEYHLSVLAAAVAYQSPALYRDYLSWARVTLAAYGVRAEDVEQNLLCLRDVVSARLPAGAREAVEPYFEAGLGMPPDAGAAPSPFITGEDDLAALARQYLEALLRGERHEAARLVLEAVRGGVTVSDIYLGVFQRSQQEIGRRWQLRQITVAQEHYCTAATQLTMSQLYPFLFDHPRNGRRLVAASVSGEQHEVGLRIVADLMEADGWDTIYLGANLPAPAVAQTVEMHRADLLLISATLGYHVAAVERLVGLVRASEAGRETKIVVGGYPFRVDPDLWRRVGADGFAADAAEALSLADRLVRDLPLRDRSVAPGPTAGLVPTTRADGVGWGGSEPALYSELSRVNNELLTAQREMARQNALLERFNERLVEADRRKDEFLAMLAHELRNPLAPLRNAAHLLQHPGADRPSLERTGAMMDRQVQQLGRLVDDLLDLSRIARGKMQLRRERVDLERVVWRAAEVVRPLMEARRHELIVNAPRGLHLLADPGRLEQVLVNLLTNAARYTPPGGRVELTATVDDGEAVVRVRDTGIGIPAEMLGRIFGLFAQTGRPEESRAGGLGIGLALVKSLTEMHGARVEAHSEGPGRGSEFVLRWPAAAEATPPLPLLPEGAAADPDRSLSILLVDDDKDAAESLAMLLRLWGHDVTIAHDGPAALRVVEGRTPEVAVLDIGLPEMDGYELARRLRRSGRSRRPLLVALTGLGQDEDRRRSAAAGFDHHLVKPVELSTLQELLAQVAV